MTDGSGGSYEWIPGWGELPSEVEGEDVAAVAVDQTDQVYVLSRSELPVVVLDKSGRFVRAWGRGDFVRAHGIHIAADGSIWCVDDEGQRLIHYSARGHVLERIEYPNRIRETGYVVGRPRSVTSASGPFCFPTGVVSEDGGDLWVTDGYGNARLHHFDAERQLIGSWGRPGDGPGEFVIPHGVVRLPNGTLLVCDRENERVQTLSRSGEMIGVWGEVWFPNNIATRDHVVYFVAEKGDIVQGVPPEMRIVPDAPYARVTVRDSAGRLLRELLPLGGSEMDMFFSPHGIAVDSAGDVYVAEVRKAYSRGLDNSGRASFGKLLLHAV